MVVDPDINEKEALETLVRSDGWTLFLAHVEEEWGPTAYARKIDATISAAKTAGVSAEADICELAAAGRHVRLAAGWPVQRLAELQAAKPKGGMFAGMRRA